MAITEDERFTTRLQEELRAAHDRIAKDNAELDGLRRGRDSLLQRIEECEGLAEAAVGLRQELHQAEKEVERLRAKQPDLRARIAGLEDELEASEAKAARLEKELARYERVNERIHGASHVLDLFPGGSDG
jgi:chromosome segregation ATPase